MSPYVPESALTMSPTTVTAFSNGWVAGTVAGAPFYYIDPTGHVFLGGGVKSGTAAVQAFVLPAGFRPGIQRFFPVLLNGGGMGYASVDHSTGAVIPYQSTECVFDGTVHFLAGA